MADPQIVRVLGKMEQYSTARHSLGLYFGVSVACRYAVPRRISKLDVLRPTIERAVARVVLEQPYMRVGIIDEDTNYPAYVHIPSINLSRHIRWLDPLGAQDIDRTMECELSEQLSYPWENLDRQPPWKVTVFIICESKEDTDKYNDNNDPDAIAAVEVLYTYHHALGDGTSGTIFHDQLLRAVSSPDPSLTSSLFSSGVSLTLSEPADLAPTQEELVPFRLSWPYFLRAVWRGYGPSWLQSKPDTHPWSGLLPADISRAYAMNLRLFSIPAGTATMLVPLARAHDTTTTGLFHALTATSLARRLPASEARSFLSGSAISLRRCVDRRTTNGGSFDPETQFAILVSSIAHSVPLETLARLRDAAVGRGGGNADEAMWDVARAVTASLRERVATLPRDDVSGLLKYIADMRAFVRYADGKPFSWTWQVSNVGAMLPCPPRKTTAASEQQVGAHDDGVCGNEAAEGAADRWKITRAVFSQSALKTSAAVMLNLVGLVGGELTCTVTWQDGIMDDKVMEDLVADLQAFCRSLGDNETLGL
ncbi:hypothetical protein SODALDRAFT_331555 [Sodiomyces alkalinus F11]|uniref:Alcohol acetyltransferase n=1 Tax=Sodiomyces alkalinus (strain CBS 110278 / VKM F-3762 / F11) TaxID=1314773 RepID=A0A3N2Q4T1_SODAK|nr:hypothetical protein SODALDRAFT_331555 [Sodiomyces alkalinus F11]ROT41771.1 hypothetical protein SODALDRAFT_331555 [Sodiomyces alkalinus F11]